jgi:oligosaccharide repeat unit polymerase
MNKICVVFLVFCAALALLVGNDNNLLPFLVVLPILLTIVKGIYEKREVFSPYIFFPIFYLLWMGGGYLINFYGHTLFSHMFYSQIAFLILLAYLSWFIGLHFPKIKLSPPSPQAAPLAEGIPQGFGYDRTTHISLLITIIGLLFSALFYSQAISTLLSGPIEETRYTMTFGRGYLSYLANSVTIAIPIYIGTKWYFRKSLNIVDYMLIMLPVVLMAISLSRAPILWYIISFIIIYHYIKKPISLKKGILFAILLFVLSIAIILVRAPGTTFLERILIEIRVHVLNLSLYLNNLDTVGNLNFQSFILNLSMLLPGHQPDFGLWLKDKLGLNFLGGGISVTLIGEGMMNARLLGVIIEFFVIGYILNIMYGRFRRFYSLRNLFIYFILISRAVSAINYGLSKEIIVILYGLILVVIIIPKYVYHENPHENTIGK